MKPKKITTASVIPSNRQVNIDQQFVDGSKVTEPFPNYLFQRLVAKKVSFEGVNFKYSIFDTCYLRNCSFQDCDFTGCRFTSSNLHGSSFSGCKFDYVIFERTIVDSEILDIGCPSSENLKFKFARTLRTNFLSLGDAESVNKAIKVELDATREHLWKAWASNESYYRKKYKTWRRLNFFSKWLKFKILDYIWGNGESWEKLIVSSVFLLAAMSIVDVFLVGKDRLALTSYADSFLHAPLIFFGASYPTQYPELYIFGILAVRLLAVGALLSIIIKRYSRR